MEDDKAVEVTYKFSLPDNRDELTMFQNASKFFMALHDIHDSCRNVWKYKEDATDAEIEFAEKIGEIVSESGVFEIE